MVFETDYASARQLISWVLCLARERRAARARRSSPPRPTSACSCCATATAASSSVAETVDRPRRVPAAQRRAARSNGRSESVIRPERFARLVTLAGLLIGAAREDEQPADRPGRSTSSTSRSTSCARTSTSSTSSTSAAAPTSSTPRSSATRSRSTPTPTATTSPARRGCCRSRRRRWSPRSTSSATTCRRPGLQTAREKIVAALGHDPSEEGLEIAPGRDDSRSCARSTTRSSSHRVLELQYYKENEDEFVKREVEPYQLVKRPRGLVPRLLRPRPRATPATSASTG